MSEKELQCEHPDNVGLMLLHTSMLLRRRLSATRYMSALHEMCGRNAWLLYYLLEQEKTGRKTYQKDIEQSFSMTRSGVSRLTGSMEKEGIIERKAVPGDARLKQIVLTEKGRELASMAECERHQMEAELVEGLSSEDVTQLKNALGRIAGNISACGYSGKGGTCRSKAAEPTAADRSTAASEPAATEHSTAGAKTGEDIIRNEKGDVEDEHV